MSTPIPIVGGGIAGLATALALAHHGVQTHVYEQAPAFEEVGAGLQLSPNAMGILRALGLEPALLEHAVEPQGITLRDGRSSRTIADLPLGQTAQQRYGAPYLVIHRADLQAVLVKACEASDQIQLSLGSHFKHNDSHAQDADLVIAADGVHSAWRQKVRPSGSQEADKHFTGYVAWRSILPATKEDEPDRTQVYFGNQAHVVDYPMRGGAQRNVVVLASADDPRPVRAQPSKTLKSALNGWHPSVSDRLLAHDSWTPWPLFSVDPQAQWVNERVALVGDAAHSMLPFLAQGAAMAIEDAWVLANMVTAAAQPYQGLERYQMARRPRVTRVWKEAAQNGRTYHLTPPLSLARNAVMRALSGERLLARYDWLYRWQGTGT